MSVTFNEGFNLYEGTIAERPDPGAAYLNSLYRASDTGEIFRCDTKIPLQGFSYTGVGGYFWNSAFEAGTFYAQKTIQDGDTIANTASETAFETQIGLLGPDTIHVGVVLRAILAFRYGSELITPGTLTLRFKHDDGGGAATLLASSAYALPLGASAQDVVLSVLMTCTADGQIIGHLETVGSLIDSGQGAVIPCAPGAGVSFDTIVDETFLATAQFSLADADNTITMRQFVMEILNPVGV